jgi:hypothetical protein
MEEDGEGRLKMNHKKSSRNINSELLVGENEAEEKLIHWGVLKGRTL